MNNTSFRDPSGFIFERDGVFYRQINKAYKDDYEHFVSSGLYDTLLSKGLILSHEEVDLDIFKNNNFYKFIKPKQLKYISYPYEWSFSALKDVALLTLEIQKTVLKYNMSLKDASAYNVQFLDAKPVFIDTLSFEKLNVNNPWVAYGQFCRHFLAPLALMSYSDIRLNELLITNIDGIPLDLAAQLLPKRARLNFGVLTHIFMHSASQKRHEADNSKNGKTNFSKFAFEALIDSLESCVKSLKFPKIFTEWGRYYENTNYTEKSFLQKKKIISDFIDKVNPKTLCDFGANRGDFSQISATKGIDTIAFDIDPVAVEDCYLNIKKNNQKRLLPLIQDFTNPSPAIGFANLERKSFCSRFGCDMVMALALIHHLAISNNLPFKNIASFFRGFGDYLVIEFVPKSDSKVQCLLSTREDIFDNYTMQDFESAFCEYYQVIEKVNIEDSQRILYLMKGK